MALEPGAADRGHRHGEQERVEQALDKPGGLSHPTCHRERIGSLIEESPRDARDQEHEHRRAECLVKMTVGIAGGA